MYAVILRRLGQGVVVALGVVILVFVLMRVIPGDPARLMAPMAPAEQLEELRHEFGLDQPIYVQFGQWLYQAVTGNFGYSLYFKEPVTLLVARSFPYTLLLVSAAVALALLVSVPLGVLSAVYRDSWFDRLALMFSVVAQSLPNFWLALMLLFVIAIRFDLVPAIGFRGPAYLVLPVVSLSFALYATFIRNVRLVMIGALESNYVTAARARGIKPWSVVMRHAFRNGWIPIITILGVQVGYLLGGAIVVEYIYNYPGMGLLLIRSVLRRDYPVIQMVALAMSLIFIVINMLVDISYGYIDPRIRKRLV
jgi:ABC-type dipeptide/oligopeptide/nickel transport system permease component